ncbi:MAG: hypothetical protein U0790_07115 [Isosphaeraceae bacterium]
MQTMLDGPRLRERAACTAFDPAQFASRIRQLALDAHHLLKDPFAPVEELTRLTHRIDDLRRESPGGWSSAVSRWLRNVEDLLVTREHPHA